MKPKTTVTNGAPQPPAMRENPVLAPSVANNAPKTASAAQENPVKVGSVKHVPVIAVLVIASVRVTKLSAVLLSVAVASGEKYRAAPQARYVQEVPAAPAALAIPTVPEVRFASTRYVSRAVVVTVIAAAATSVPTTSVEPLAAETVPAEQGMFAATDSAAASAFVVEIVTVPTITPVWHKLVEITVPQAAPPMLSVLSSMHVPVESVAPKTKPVTPLPLVTQAITVIHPDKNAIPSVRLVPTALSIICAAMELVWCAPANPVQNVQVQLVSMENAKPAAPVTKTAKPATTAIVESVKWVARPTSTAVAISALLEKYVEPVVVIKATVARETTVS